MFNQRLHGARPLALLLVLLLCASAARAHDWRELDTSAQLADAAVALRVAAAVQAAYLPAERAPSAAAWPPELAWFRWIEAHVADEGRPGRTRIEEALALHAVDWIDDLGPAAAARWWWGVVRVVAEHAAARGVTEAERDAAYDALEAAELPEADLVRLSWVAVLPALDDEERRDLASVFAALDALVAAGGAR